MMGRKKYDHVSTSEGTASAARCETNPIQNSLLCYHCLNGSAPRCLTSLLSPHKPSRSLRSNRDVLKLHVPCSQRLWGDRAFSVAAPHMWIICPSKSGPNLQLILTNLYWNTHIFTVVNHMSCAMDTVVEWRNTNLMTDWYSYYYTLTNCIVDTTTFEKNRFCWICPSKLLRFRFWYQCLRKQVFNRQLKRIKGLDNPA